MKQYRVTVPIAGFVVLLVEAESEKDAIEAAMAAPVNMNLDVDDESVIELEHWEWEMHKRIIEGNVLYAMQNRVEAEEA